MGSNSSEHGQQDDALEEEGVVFLFDTMFRKETDEPTVLNFDVTLRKYEEYGDVPGPVVASLSGFLFQPGYLPEEDDEGYFDVFDMRSGHAAEAYGLLVGETALIEKALKPDGVWFEGLGSVVYFERAWVHSGLRGRQITLRLFREAMHVLARPGLIVMVKAFPDEKGTDASCRKLADYYRSDDRLKLRVLSSRKHPGWLVGVWEEPSVFEGDGSRLWGDFRNLPKEVDPHPN